MSAGALAPKTSVVDQLAQLEVKPEQVKFVGISHYHADHTGQAASFPQATLLIGKGDWDVLTSPKPPATRTRRHFAHWISGGGKVEPVPLDKDVFGDGTVIMLDDAGSHARAPQPAGQAAPDRQRARHRRRSPTSTRTTTATACRRSTPGRAESLASLDRFKKIAANTKATVIIQHDARDVAKLPAFPAAAK